MVIAQYYLQSCSNYKIIKVIRSDSQSHSPLFHKSSFLSIKYYYLDVSSTEAPFACGVVNAVKLKNSCRERAGYISGYFHFCCGLIDRGNATAALFEINSATSNADPVNYINYHVKVINDCQRNKLGKLKIQFKFYLVSLSHNASNQHNN